MLRSIGVGLRLAVALGLALAVGPGPASGAPARAQAIIHVTMIDPGTSGDEHADTTLVLRAGRIVAVGPSATTPVPPGAVVHDARGRYVIPGLWDVHVHLTQVGARAFPRLIANGVTSVRDMGSALPDIVRWRAARAAGAAIPRILTPGPKIDGATEEESRRLPRFPDRVFVTSPEQARATVRVLKAEGVDFIKVHNNMTPELYDAVVSAAHEAGLTVSGHTPMAGPIAAAEAGQVTIEHGWRMAPCSAADWARIDSVPAAHHDLAYCASPDTQAKMFPALIRAGVRFTPTLVSWRSQLMTGEPDLERRIAALPGDDRVWPALRRHWVFMADEPLTPFERTLVGRMGELAASAAQAGVPLLAGSDLGDPYIIPGYALQEELQLMAAAGVPALTVLRSATSEPARAFGLASDLGSIAPGYAADLVVLDADPLDDIRNTQRIAAVVLAGHWMPARRGAGSAPP